MSDNEYEILIECDDECPCVFNPLAGGHTVVLKYTVNTKVGGTYTGGCSLLQTCGEAEGASVSVTFV